jgi:signal transduction histidine kinase/ActR/RegA family two-component response regulator
MALSLRDIPIKRKLMLVMLLTSSFALLLMGSALITYELVTFRRALAVNIGVLAQIIGSNSTAALAFDDAKSAREILAALSAEQQITSAAIYDQRGRIFASFPVGVPISEFPKRPGSDGHMFERAHLVMFQPILQEGTRLGTIYLEADLGEMYSRFGVYGTLLLLVSGCSFLGAMGLSATLQRRISLPILELAEVATAVSERQDYSVRGTKHGADEIGQLTEAFNQMLTRIGESNAALTASEERLRLALEGSQAANQAKDNFLAILSHELRTPLTPALATVAMLEKDQTVPSHLLRELEIIRRNIEVEARLIDDLLDITGIVRGKLDLNRQVVDVRPLLQHAMQNYCAGTAAKKNLRVSMEITASETHVVADSSRMTQVFWNLLQNACKFTPNAGAIDIRVYNEYPQIGPNKGVSSQDGEQPPRAELVVEISDDGIGISPETMPRIFNAFEQGNRSRTGLFGGLGLGLAISRAIVERHGGFITATSEGKDKGTKFFIRLQTVKPVVTGGSQKPPSSSREPTPARSLRVLLVEDHPDTAEQLTRLLKRAGHEVSCAGSIREAQNYAIATAAGNETCAFDILISDLGLPDGSGHDLMRDLARRHPIRGIALSGYGMKDDIENSIAAGFSRHMTKPVDWQELKVAIQKIAEEPQPAGGLSRTDRECASELTTDNSSS